jgi:hypothetical protein
MCYVTEDIMALSNAERQARWRAKRNKLAREAETFGAGSQRMAQFLSNLFALIWMLEEEGRKDLATFSPNTIKRYVTMLKKQVETMANGEDIPDLTGPDGRRAKLVRAELTGEALTDDKTLLKKLRQVT